MIRKGGIDASGSPPDSHTLGRLFAGLTESARLVVAGVPKSAPGDSAAGFAESRPAGGIRRTGSGPVRCRAGADAPGTGGGKPPGPVRASSQLLAEPRNNSLDLEGLNLEQILSVKWEETERLPHLSLVFFSGANRMAVIDGKVVRQGSRLPDGSRVLGIERTGVLVARNGKVRRLVWHSPRQVRLSREGS